MRQISEIELDSDRALIATQAYIGIGWACAPKHMSAEDVQRSLDEQELFYLPAAHGQPPTPWTVVPVETDNPNWQSPGRCDSGDTRQHWLLSGGMSGIVMLALTPDFPDHGIPETLAIRLAQGEQQ